MKLVIIIPTLLLTFHFGNSNAKTITLTAPVKPDVLTSYQDTIVESQLLGVWFFLSKDGDKNTKSKNLEEGKSMTLKADHSFESDVFNKSEKGTWSLNEETQVLTLETEESKTKWKIKNFNVFGMVLINVENNEEWLFAA